MKALFDCFETRSIEVQTKLGEILQTIQAGKVPSEAICAETGEALSQLRETYNNVRTGVAESILPDELPEGEASLSEYRAAWEGSIKRRKDSTLAILKEFLRVYSEEERYMKALERPLAEAESLLRDLEGGTGDNTEAKHYELFLKGVKTDLSTDQELVYQIEDDLEGVFPARMIFGLIRDKYSIRPIEEKSDADESEPATAQKDEEAPAEGTTTEPESEDSIEVEPSESVKAPAEEYIDVTPEEFAERFRSVYKELHADRETGC